MDDYCVKNHIILSYEKYMSCHDCINCETIDFNRSIEYDEDKMKQYIIFIRRKEKLKRILT